MINLLHKDYTDAQGMVLEANQSLNPNSVSYVLLQRIRLTLSTLCAHI